MKKLILISLFLSSTFASNAQVLIQSSPLFGNFNTQQLYQVSISNLGLTPISGRLVGVLIKNSNLEEVMAIEGAIVELSPGSTVNQFEISWKQPIFSSSRTGELLRITNQLIPGNYQYCYKFFTWNTNDIIAESCQEFIGDFIKDFELTSPFDGERVTDLYPLLTWENYWLPSSIQGSYQLQLKELRPNQSPAEAMVVNPPVFIERGLSGNMLKYPQESIQLEIGKSYVWQVSAVGPDGKQYDVSSIWTFSFEDSTLQSFGKSILTQNSSSFPLISQHSKAVSYLNQGSNLLFAYDNWDSKITLDYAICKMEMSGGGVIDNVPEINLIRGLNTIEVPISSIPGLTYGEKYCLYIYDSRGVHTMNINLQN